MSIIINKAAVRRSLETWFIAAREGKTLGARETAEMSAHDAAAQSSDYFYDLLCNDEDSQPVTAYAVVDLIAAEDIAAGQYVAINSDGKVIGAQTLSGDGSGAALSPITGEPEAQVVEPEKPARKRTKPTEASTDDFFG